MTVKHYCAIALCALLGSVSLKAADEGSVTGVVAGKGETWLSVKSEGQEEATMYMPHWRGGLPADGGGLDKEMLALIKSTSVGSKVKLNFKNDERPRVVGLETLAAPEKQHVAEKPENGDAEHGDKKEMKEGKEERRARKEKERAAEHGDAPEKDDKHDRMPRKDRERAEEKSGSFIGVIISKGESYIEVKASREAPAEKYFARMFGKGDNAGPDRDMVKSIRAANLNQRYKIEWNQGEEHKRIMKITPAP